MNCSDEKFKLALLEKKLILESDALLSNIPKRDYYNKNKIKEDITNILYLIYLANNIEDTKSRLKYQHDILARLSMIDFYLERAYLLKYISQKQLYNYILKLDIKKYFYSLDHEVLLLILLKDKLADIDYKFINIMIESTNEDYINKEIEKLKINEIKRNPNRREEIEDLSLYNKGKGLSIGMMTNQFLAIFNLYKLHNYIIHKLKIKHFVCYIDDYILIHHDKQYLKYC